MSSDPSVGRRELVTHLRNYEAVGVRYVRTNPGAGPLSSVLCMSGKRDDHPLPLAAGECTAGSRPLATSVDERMFFVPLAKPLEVSPQSTVHLEIRNERVGLAASAGVVGFAFVFGAMFGERRRRRTHAGTNPSRS